MKYDYLIVGAGIIGMTIAYELKLRDKGLNIIIVEKENDVGLHASGRNSGVLHAGFYYTADSLKAKLTVDGNRLMKEFCFQNGICVNSSQKVVIAQDQDELEALEELKKRGDINGVRTELISTDKLEMIDPNIKTYKKALFSPDTASVDPREVCRVLKEQLMIMGVEFKFSYCFERKTCDIEHYYLINAAGLYADKIAHSFDQGSRYTILPFKGKYLKSVDKQNNLKINVYPVPNLKNPFLGVHFTITHDGSVKIGPTAIPAFWREHYEGFGGFKLLEFLNIVWLEAKLFMGNRFNFRTLAFEEMANYRKKTFISKAKRMLKSMDEDFVPVPAGIRAQLYDRIEKKLEMDFVAEHSTSSTHILNAVSPAFTCSFALAKYVVDQIEENRKS